jgi:hypothetical protein
MPIERIFAHLSCTNLDRSIGWFERFYDRPPDARPMAGLAEWHHGAAGGMQLFEDTSNAGHGTLTLIVTDIAAEHRRLAASGLAPGALERGDYVALIRMRDPDDNFVVLAEPARG